MVPAEAKVAGSLHVQVAYAAGPHAVELIELDLPVGATVRDALVASGLAARIAAADFAALKPGIWGRLKPVQTLLRDGDRIELYRPLTVDPKEARRLRYKRDGLKRAASKAR
jgi:uncharacterized protein